MSCSQIIDVRRKDDRLAKIKTRSRSDRHLEDASGLDFEALIISASVSVITDSGRGRGC